MYQQPIDINVLGSILIFKFYNCCLIIHLCWLSVFLIFRFAIFTIATISPHKLWELANWILRDVDKNVSFEINKIINASKYKMHILFKHYFKIMFLNLVTILYQSIYFVILIYVCIINLNIKYFQISFMIDIWHKYVWCLLKSLIL